MGKLNVKLTGLNKLFVATGFPDKSSLKDSTYEKKIIYITCDEEDAAIFGNAYTTGKKYIWANNILFDGNTSSSSGGEVPVIYKGTEDPEFTIEPNTVYVWDEMLDLNLSLVTPSSTDIVNHYFFQFTSGDTPTSLSLPDTISYIGDSTIVANRIYQCSILNNIAKLGGAAIPVETLSIFDFNVSTVIGTTVSSNTGQTDYDVKDDKEENTATFSVIGGGSSWQVTTGTYTYTLNGTSYTSSYQLQMQGSGSTTTRCVSVDLTGPCTIYIAARQNGNTSRTINAYVDGSSIGSFTTTSSSSVTVGTITYSGSGGTVKIYPNGNSYFYHIELDYNV